MGKFTCFFFSYDDFNNILYKLGDDDLDEEDPFAEVSTNISLFNYVLICFQIDEGFSEDDLDAKLQREKNARLCSLVNQMIDELTPAAPDFQLRDACDQLVGRIRVSTNPF